MNSVNNLFQNTFLFENALLDYQKDIFREVVEQHDSDFYVPLIRDKYPMNLKMLCLGKHWNPADYQYHLYRKDHDGLPVAPIPNVLIDAIKPFALQVFPYHNPDWDICIINKYEAVSSLGLHRDNSETEKALDIGHPVVSISLGGACDFVIGRARAADVVLKLEDGDVLVFGGGDRLIYHGVNNVIASRINFTFRKY